MFKDFFSQKKSRQPFSDIVPSSQKKIPVKETKKKKPQVEVYEEKYEEKTEEVLVERPRSSFSAVLRRIYFSVLLLAVIGGLAYLGLKVLPRLEITINLKQYPLVFNKVADASKNFSQASGGSASSTLVKLPAELLSQSRNINMSFPATGKQKIETKAAGKITIYNAYSSDSQKLVATTRFAAPDNKIFHLTKTVTIPGAKIQEGKIIPSSIGAEVAADAAGAEYNIGPVAKFTIPGLKGSPKYEGFYAVSNQPMTGGFVGEAAAPTAKDISSAEDKIKQVLQDSLKLAVLAQLPQDFKVIDGSSKFEITKETVDKVADKNNNFGIYMEARTRLIAFREKDLRDTLVAQLLTQLSAGDYDVIDSNINYGAPRSDFDNGEMSFSVQGQITFRNKINFDLLKREAVNKNELALKTLIFSLPGLEKAQIYFWPIYVKTAPDNVGKIKINVQ